MNFDFDKWYNESFIGQTIYAYKGAISSDQITDALNKIETELKSQNEKSKILKKIYNVLVESLQNLYHHIDPPPLEDRNLFAEKFAAVIFFKEKSHYSVTTGNFVKKEKIRVLSDRLDQINYLSSGELKTVYKIILNNNEFSDKGGGGLGMIDIARKTGNKLTYKFHDYNSEYYFFSLSIVII